jgi:micrococcal nuclease
VGAERLGAIALAVAALLAAGCRGSTTTDDGAPQAGGTTAVVEWVNDGDTLTLTNGAKVRLVQVDAPELETDCYGRPALQALIALTPKGTRVRLAGDPALDDRDRYGRLLRYVFVGDENVNVELVRRGAASPYFFGNERGAYAAELLDAVDDARDAGRGYWGACPDAALNTGLGSITGRR